jgi:hypothetical protein
LYFAALVTISVGVCAAIARRQYRVLEPQVTLVSIVVLLLQIIIAVCLQDRHTVVVAVAGPSRLTRIPSVALQAIGAINLFIDMVNDNTTVSKKVLIKSLLASIFNQEILSLGIARPDNIVVGRSTSGWTDCIYPILCNLLWLGPANL